MDNTGRNSVLVVDDEKLNLEILSKILEVDYTVYLTKSGRSAIDMAKKYTPDLILLDIIMPDLDGFEVLSALKSMDETCNIPVIYITGLDSVEYEEKGLALEAADFIYKPFSEKIVKLRVRNQIQMQNQIKELMMLHKDLESAVKAAESANQAKSAFLAKMSHEIRTPLNAVLGISEIQLQNESLAYDVKESFTRIFNSGDLLLGIINDILDMSKIEAGKLELFTLNYDVESLINDTVFLNLIKYENKPIEFILNVDENVPVELHGDELRIKQIINNILSNAFKYTDQGEVELAVNIEEVSKDSVMLVLKIRDSGQGMTEEQVKQLFDEYSRFNSEANRTTEGTGLGMGITKNLINLMNGEIHAQSEYGKGSVFTVRLLQGNTGAPPLGKETVTKLRQFRVNFEAKNKKVHITRKPIPFGKVLVVDDIEMNLYVAKSMLTPYGLQIETAASGQEAIDKVKSLCESGSKYDIIFMDHMMPVMDGVETTALIRSWEEESLKNGIINKKHPIIALTANAVTGIREMFLQNGFDGFISKPIAINELDNILKDWLLPEKIASNGDMEQNKTLASQSSSDDAANDSFINDINTNTGINTEIGLNQLMGNKEAYRNTLEIFNKKLVSECNGMNSSLESNDLNNFKISVHAMKSMLAIIGELNLSETALKLESAAKENQTEYCLQNFPPLKEELLSLNKKLNEIFEKKYDKQETEKEQNNTKKENNVPSGLKFENKKVLLVDDMDMIIFVVKEKLSRYGLQVDTALSGSEAINLIRNNVYDLIFMDHMMPEMDGIETVRRIRIIEEEEAKERLPIIALTANDIYNAKETFLANKFDGFLSKPVIKQELEKLLEEWLSK
ncbi:MAG: response regulator [Treponema sp.]|nr:response regulator [Treponema sp.]